MELDFLITGFAKCGSTTLYRYLIQHPEIFMTTPKETNYFVSDDPSREARNYESLFKAALANQLKGEGSVAYAESEFADLAKRRILGHSPKVKIIFLVRDPVRRIESQFRELHDSGFKLSLKCPKDLGDAMLKFPNILCDTHYYRLISSYANDFSIQNIHIIYLEDMARDPRSTMSELMDFLQLGDSEFSFDLGTRYNLGYSKYYDTERFRKLKEVRGARELHEMRTDLSFQERESLYRKNGLRRPFANDPIVWSRTAKRIFLKSVRKDSELLLAQTGRPRSIWPRFDHMCSEQS